MSKVFHGLDYQGRYESGPQGDTAEVWKEIPGYEGHDDMEGAGVIVTPVVILALIAVISFCVWVMP